jgi:hypothetical protein
MFREAQQYLPVNSSNPDSKDDQMKPASAAHNHVASKEDRCP